MSVVGRILGWEIEKKDYDIRDITSEFENRDEDILRVFKWEKYIIELRWRMLEVDYKIKEEGNVLKEGRLKANEIMIGRSWEEEVKIILRDLKYNNNKFG